MPSHLLDGPASMAFAICRPADEWMILHHIVDLLGEDATQLIANHLHGGELEAPFQGWVTSNGTEPHDGGYIEISCLDATFVSRLWLWRVGFIIVDEDMDPAMLVQVNVMRDTMRRYRAIILPLLYSSSEYSSSEAESE